VFCYNTQTCVHVIPKLHLLYDISLLYPILKLSCYLCLGLQSEDSPSKLLYAFLISPNTFFFLLYFTARSVARLLNVEWKEDRRMMDLKRLGKKLPLPKRGTIPAFTWRDWVKLQKTSVSLAGVPVEIRTEHVPNTGQQRYLYCNPFTSPVAYRKLKKN
jgi:hypothetical protein